MSDTFEQYMEFLRKNRDLIRGDLIMPANSPRRQLYSRVFRDNFLPYDSPGIFGRNIAATDSTEFVRELYNGKKLILVRAYTALNRKIYNSFVARVISVGRTDIQRFLTMLMEHSEHLSILEMLRHERPDYVLVDGSIGGRLNMEQRTLSAEGYSEFHANYLETLARMLDQTSALGIPLVFIAKSSESRAFKEVLLKIIEADSGESALIREERESKVNDHFIVKSLADRIGYTRPVQQNSTMHVDGRSRQFRYITTHILPGVEDLPIKIDVILADSGEDTGKIPEDILAMAFWGYGDIKTHNIWLADVDRLVKFRRDEAENIYMRAFEREIGISFYETRGERRARIRI